MTTMTDPTYDNAVATRWEELRAAGFGADHERASLLHAVLTTRLDGDAALLGQFCVAVLGEHPGKSTARLVRMAASYAVVASPDTWRAVGALGVALLARMRDAERRRVMRGVRETLASTERPCVSPSKFSTLLRATLGAERAKEVRLEPRTGGKGADLRAELAALKAFVLALIERDPSLKRRLPRDVRRALGMDLVRA